MTKQKLNFGLSAAIAAVVAVPYIAAGGAVEELKINVQFKRLTKADRREIDTALNENVKLSRAWQADKDAGKDVPETAPVVMSDEALIDKVLLSWDLKDADAQPIGVDTESRAAVAEQFENLTHALVVAFFDRAWSVERAKAAAAKN